MITRSALSGLALLAAGIAAAPAQAQDAPTKPITVNGNVALVSDYRYRGVSQSDKGLAIQGGITVTHESGFYVGTWASNLAGWGQFGGSNMELDLIGGVKKSFGSGAIDVGLTWYMYPSGSDETDFAEPYIKISGTAGPVTLLGGVAYAPKQEALGNWSFTGAASAAGIFDDPNDKEDNLYLWGDFSSAIPNTPITAKAHIGYSDGNPGLGPNGTSVAPTGKYWDYSVGADVVLGPLVVGVSYVDTDISRRDRAYLLPNFSKGGTDSISSGTFLASLSAAF